MLLEDSLSNLRFFLQLLNVRVYKKRQLLIKLWPALDWKWLQVLSQHADEPHCADR